MRRGTSVLIPLTGLLLTTGCGTVMNVVVPTRTTVPEADRLSLQSPATVPSPPMRHVYGGVEYDWGTILATLRNAGSFPQTVLLLPLFLVDLPITAVGDTLTLPYTLSPPAAPVPPKASLPALPPSAP